MASSRPDHGQATGDHDLTTPPPQPTLAIVPVTIREAAAFVERHHRHHTPPRGALFQMAAAAGESVVGVAIVGRPVARLLQDGWTAEVTRLCVLDRPEARNASSMLLGAAWRAARALGWARLVTYTLPSEGGASLRGAGWRCVGEAGGGTWHRRKRPRVDKHPLQEKLRWERSVDDL